MSKNKYILTRNKLNDFFTNTFESFFETHIVRFINIFIKENIALYTKVIDDIDNEFVNDEKLTHFLMLDVRHKLERYKIYIPGVTQSRFGNKHSLDYKMIDFPETVIPGNDEIDHKYYMTTQHDMETCVLDSINSRSDDYYSDGRCIAVTRECEAGTCDCTTDIHRPLQDARRGFGSDLISEMAVNWRPGKGGAIGIYWRGDTVPFTYCYPFTSYNFSASGTGHFSVDKSANSDHIINMETHFDKNDLYNLFYRILLDYSKDVVFRENPEMYRMDGLYPFTTVSDGAFVPEQYYTVQEIYKQIVGNLIATLNVKDIQTYIYNHQFMEELKTTTYLSALDSISKFYKNVASTSSSQFMIKCLKDRLLKSNGQVAIGNRMPTVDRDHWSDLRSDVSPGNNAAISAGNEYMLYEAISSLFQPDCHKIGNYKYDYAYKHNGAISFFSHIVSKLHHLFMVEASLSTGTGKFNKDDFKAYIDTYPEWFDKWLERIKNEGGYWPENLEFIEDTLDSLSGAIAGLALTTFQFRTFLEMCQKKSITGTREQLVRMYDSRYRLFERSLRDFEKLAYDDMGGEMSANHTKMLVRLADLLCIGEVTGFIRQGVRDVNNRISDFARRVSVTNESEERIVNDLTDIVAPLVAGDDPVVENFVKDEDVNISNVEEKCEEGLDFLTLAQVNGDDDFKMKAAKRLVALENYYSRYLSDRVSQEYGDTFDDEGNGTDNPQVANEQEPPSSPEEGGEEGEDKPDVKAVAKAALKNTKNPEVKKNAKKILSKKEKKAKVEETMETLIFGLKGVTVESQAESMKKVNAWFKKYAISA